MEIFELTRSKLRKDLLKHFFLHPGERFYLRELERLLGHSAANLRRELKKLQQSGLFFSQKVGNLTYYSVDKQYPFYGEIRGLVLKSVGLIEILKDNLRGIAGIKLAFIYGSFAQGKEIKASDLDLMVIGDFKRSVLTPQIYKIERATGRQVNLLTYSAKEVADRIIRKNPFILNVLKSKKLMVIGEENELPRLGKR